MTLSGLQVGGAGGKVPRSSSASESVKSEGGALGGGVSLSGLCDGSEFIVGFQNAVGYKWVSGWMNNITTAQRELAKIRTAASFYKQDTHWTCRREDRRQLICRRSRGDSGRHPDSP